MTYITQYNSVSSLGLSTEDFKKNLKSSTSCIRKLDKDCFVSEFFGINFLGLLPEQLLIDNFLLNNRNLIEQKKTLSLFIIFKHFRLKLD